MEDFVMRGKGHSSLGTLKVPEQVEMLQRETKHHTDQTSVGSRRASIFLFFKIAAKVFRYELSYEKSQGI